MVKFDIEHIKRCSEYNKKIYETLWESQITDYNMLMSEPRFALGRLVAAGKTRVTICGMLNHAPSKVLIVCETQLQLNWRDELNNLVPFYKVFVVPSVNRQKAYTDAINCKEPCVLITRNRSIAPDEELIKKFKPDFIIADEAHFLRNINATTKAFGRIAYYVKDTPIKFLSATFIVNSLYDLYPILKCCDKETFSSKKVFKTNFLVTETFDQGSRTKEIVHGWKLDKDGNIPEQIRKYFYINRDTIQGVHKPIDLEFVEVSLNPEHRKIYEQMRDYYITEFRGKLLHAPVVVAAITRMRQIAISPELITSTDKYSNEITSDKVDKILELIEEADGKVVVVSEFSSLIDKLHMVLMAKGIAALKLTGEHNDIHTAHSILNMFREEELFKVLCMTRKKGGAGLNIPEASTIIFTDLPWAGAHIEQATGRLNRYGQKADRIKVFIIMARNTVDTKIKRLAYAKLQCLEDFENGTRFIKRANNDGNRIADMI